VSLVAGQSVVAKLLDPDRYFTIASEFARAPSPERFRIGMVYLLAIYGFVCDWVQVNGGVAQGC
jgi:hypothetical protein